ncbi:MAG: methyltransferase domain-containing protein [Pyrinomonadaceae bacterium]|nr:methyltransferase domain-containing protein [Pyrinomonadaceae bacterium]
MVEKKKAKKPSKRRGGKDSRRGAAPIVSSPAVLSLSLAAGVRLLRERVEAGSASKQVRTKLAEALSWLETEYERVQGATGSRVFLPRFQVVPGDEKGPAFATSVTEANIAFPRPRVHFVPTPPELVEVMLKIAKVTREDVVYDLGSGDGRIVIAAAKQYGARGIGIDIDPQRIKEAIDLAAEEGVADRVSFRQVDLFEANIQDATVVTLYLLPAVNLELRQRLLDQLKPGTRIVSHEFDMGDWPPAKTLEVDGRRVYLWIVPDRSTKLP